VYNHLYTICLGFSFLHTLIATLFACYKLSYRSRCTCGVIGVNVYVGDH